MMARKRSRDNIAWAAFLRGIGPGDPRKSNESLRRVFERLGFDNVRSFISSGNILFESPVADADELERTIEQGFRDQLDLDVPSFVRSREEIDTFLRRNPFGELTHSRESYLTVTLLRTVNQKQGRGLAGKGTDDVRVISYDAGFRAVCAVTDTTASRAPDFMVWLERTLGKEITTRTHNTMERVLRKL